MARDKQKITQELLVLLPQSLKIDLKQAVNSWWFNIRKSGGMRLTSTGFDTFSRVLDLEHYDYNINDPTAFNQHMILNLDRKMQMPYYIHAVKGVPKKIVFFGSKEAMLANLYGDLEKFLDNYSI